MSAYSIIQDRIQTFWEISKKELEEREAELRNTARAFEEMQDQHQLEIKVEEVKTFNCIMRAMLIACSFGHIVACWMGHHAAACCLHLEDAAPAHQHKQ